MSTKERLQRLEQLDLTNVRRKLQEPYPEGKGWTEAQSLEAEKWYKRYLATIIAYPDATKHVPNGPIDTFWHQHILDTMAYGPDCEKVLGYFLHHYPYYGLNGDKAERDTSFDETNAIYREMFGEDCTQMTTFRNEGIVIEGQFGKVKATGTSCRSSYPTETEPSRIEGGIARREGLLTAQSCKGGGTGGGGGCSRGCSKGR